MTIGCAETKRHPSPADIIYFILIDRFQDGDPSNNSGNNPSSHVKYDGTNPLALKTYQGGDIRGIGDKLDYLQELGITIIWLSPFFDNSDTDYVGWWPYHGYHPIDFYQVDEHFGTMQDLKELVREAHKKGIKVIFDMAFNQTAADHPWLSDPQKQDWYHYDVNGHPFDITDWYNQEQIETGELHGLPDLAQENEKVYSYLVDMSKYWIDQTGCDGFRLDAVKHIPQKFWRKYNAEIAEYTGDGFILLGEVFWGETERIEPYTNLGFTHLFDIPGYYSIRNTFAKGGSIKFFSTERKKARTLWQNIIPVTMIDNHDVARFNTSILRQGWEKQLLALSCIFTTPGIPMLYYSAELGLPGAPVENPKTGEPQDYLNRLPFPVLNDSLKIRIEQVKQLISLRHKYSSIWDGNFHEVYKDWGIYGYLMKSGSQGMLVFINTAETPESITAGLNDWELIIDDTPQYGKGTCKRIGDYYSISLEPLTVSIWECDIEKPSLHGQQVDFTDRFTGDYQIVQFSYFDSTASIYSIEIAGDFNNWQPSAYKTSKIDSVFGIEVPLRPGEYRYKFVLNGVNWISDPSATDYEIDPYGGKNSIVKIEFPYNIRKIKLP